MSQIFEHLRRQQSRLWSVLPCVIRSSMEFTWLFNTPQLFVLVPFLLLLTSLWRGMGFGNVMGTADAVSEIRTEIRQVLRLMQAQVLEVYSGTMAVLVQAPPIQVLVRILGAVTEAGSGDRCSSPRSHEVGYPLPRSEGHEEAATVAEWNSAPSDAYANILQRFDYRDRTRFKVLSKSVKQFIVGDVFRQSHGGISEGVFTAIHYYIKNDTWRWSGYDLHSKSWRALPPLSYLPRPDAALFKEYSVCGHDGLMCAEISKLPKKGELVVFNPLTGESQALPPLLHPRAPVLVHIAVDSAERSYKVVVAGSSSASDKHLSRKVEVFNSSKSEWNEVCDLPGPSFALNEHQAGVSFNGKLFFISFLECLGRGVFAFDLEEEKWLPDLTTPIPWSSFSNILQLVENDSKLFLFSEQVTDRSVDHCIDELELPNPEAGDFRCRWRSVVGVKSSSGLGLQVYPEYECVRFGAAKLCIFNTLNRAGEVYDMRDGKKCEHLEPPPANQTGDNFFTLNPASFTLQLNYESDPRLPISQNSGSEA